MKLALKAVPQPGETARALLPPWHTVQIALEKREFEEKRERDRQEHEKKIQVCHERIKVCGWFELDMEIVSQPRAAAVTVERFCCFIERR